LLQNNRRSFPTSIVVEKHAYVSHELNESKTQEKSAKTTTIV